MNYDEALSAVISKQVALREIRNHSSSTSDFLEEVGDKEEYKGFEVLEYLGY